MKKRDIIAKGYSVCFFQASVMAEQEHRYTVSSRWVNEKIVTIEIDGKEDFRVATPLDFWPEGPIDVLSPEEMFVASAVSCYGVSLSGISNRFHVELKDFKVKGVGTLRKGELGWEFDQITIEAKIVVPTEKDRKKMEKVAERAHTYCVVANSMKCSVHLKYEISVE
jgi:organic hydroperoxide reductase OsmC/OhrA